MPLSRSRNGAESMPDCVSKGFPVCCRHKRGGSQRFFFHVRYNDIQFPSESMQSYSTANFSMSNDYQSLSLFIFYSKRFQSPEKLSPVPRQVSICLIFPASTIHTGCVHAA